MLRMLRDLPALRSSLHFHHPSHRQPQFRLSEAGLAPAPAPSRFFPEPRRGPGVPAAAREAGGRGVTQPPSPRTQTTDPPDPCRPAGPGVVVGRSSAQAHLVERLDHLHQHPLLRGGRHSRPLELPSGRRAAGTSNSARRGAVTSQRLGRGRRALGPASWRLRAGGKPEEARASEAVGGNRGVSPGGRERWEQVFSCRRAVQGTRAGLLPWYRRHALGFERTEVTQECIILKNTEI